MTDVNGWPLLLAAHLTRWAARKQRQRELREQMAAARAVGLTRRHAEKLRRLETK